MYRLQKKMICIKNGWQNEVVFIFSLNIGLSVSENETPSLSLLHSWNNVLNVFNSIMCYSVINYIKQKDCMRECIRKMREIGQLSPLDIVEMFATLFCLLKDSSKVNEKLLLDFRQHRGYEFLKDFLFKLDLPTANTQPELHASQVTSLLKES